MQMQYLFIFLCILCAYGCDEPKKQQQTPWGGETEASDGQFSLHDIQESGEMIMLTTSGPDTYFEYHGKGAGTQYLLCEKFAQYIGVSLRVDVCKSQKEMLKKLNDGDGDIIACQMPTKQNSTIACGYKSTPDSTAWAVSTANKGLADALDNWYKPEIMAEVKREERLIFSAQSVRRTVYAPMLNAKSGVISKYDHLFMRYAPVARWDWRLLAAQCYQESCFDPKAYSWAGARGLMQIMPSTAAQIGLPEEKMYDPEENIYAATRYIAMLNSKFSDIRDPRERQMFVLASYNGGFFHVRDAMSLAKKYGRNAQRWDDVAEYVLKLSSPQYYNDPVVKYGYMRGSETANYVERIRARWAQYRGAAHSEGGMPPMVGGAPGTDIPHKANKKHRFKL